MSAGSTAGFQAMALAARVAVAYRETVADAGRTPVLGYDALLSAFDAPLPEQGGDPVQIIEELVARATPGVRASTGPRFFGWVIGSSHPTGVAADWLTSAWGQNAGNVLAAPAASAVEAVAAGWLLELLDLPRSASVGFVTGATVANFVCLAAARGEVLRRAGWDVEAEGLFGAPPITVFIGADAHATVYSGLKYLGLGARRVMVIDTDTDGRMRPDALRRAMHGSEGPRIVIAQAGQINSGVSDPLEEIASLAAASGAWLHVDGAFGLWARASHARAPLVAGAQRADSWATDGHKWLQTPYDSGYAIVRDPEAHRRAMAISASYLPPALDAERDPSAYVPELSRRARGFSTWAMIRQLGRSGVAAMIDQCCDVAAAMAAHLAAEPGVTLVRPVELNQFMVRFGDVDSEGDEARRDALTLAVVRQVQEDAIAFIGSSQWRGAWVMRVSVTSMETTPADGDATVEAVLAAWRLVSGRGAI